MNYDVATRPDRPSNSGCTGRTRLSSTGVQVRGGGGTGSALALVASETSHAGQSDSLAAGRHTALATSMHLS
eukprot:9283858-Pyramimonas_sp.AAC.1